MADEHDRDWMVAPSGMCVACGRDLGAEPHFITRPPDGEHVGCRDWVCFPWPPHLEQLGRRLAGRARALRQALELTVELGRHLGERREIWPEGAAETVLEVGRRRRELRGALERAGVTP